MSDAVRPAATVVLIRDTPSGVEAWLLRRVRQMAFAPGMTVFPGGRVDELDGAGGVPWAGGEPDQVATRMGSSAALVRASMVAAVRETFEEAGVLLTRPPHAVSDSRDAGWLEARRRRVEAGELPFVRLLDELGLAVDATLIRAWARWITPAGEARRYDTVFYVAALPSGAQARAETSEAEHAQWIRPADALAEHLAGSRPMLAPTVVTLSELADFTRVDDVLVAAQRRSLTPIRPHIETGQDGIRSAVLPDGRAFAMPP